MTTRPRYGNQDLFLPKEFHAAFVDKLVSQSDERAPFYRQVDLWWYALGVGVTRGHRTGLPSRTSLTKLNDGGILESDQWRITHLELLVLAEQGEDDASNPAVVIRCANEYAITGCKVLGEELRGVHDPQLQLLLRISESPGDSEVSRADAGLPPPA